MEIVFIFCTNHILQLLITPVGALECSTSLFTGVDSDCSSCTILCSSITHIHIYMYTYMCLIAAQLCPDLDAQPNV